MFHRRKSHSTGRLPAGFRWRKWLCGLMVGFAVGLVCAKPAAILAINGYQRFISPHKGFCCAHRSLHGGPSCSEFGKQAIQDHGLMGGLILLRQRFEECHHAAVVIQSGQCKPTSPRAGDCFESDEERGKREGKEAREYCLGCAEGCCSD